jgi:hypothetical protein
MQAIEFQTRVKNGTIEIPERYQSQVGKQVRVILLSEEHPARLNLIDQLLEHPLKAESFKPLSRDEIYDRQVSSR